MRGLSAVALLSCFAIAQTTNTPQQLADQALQQTTRVCQNVQSSQQCHQKYASGCAATVASGYDPYLNFFKNQLAPSTSQPTDTVDPAKLQDLETKTPAALTSGNHRDFSKQFVALNEGEIVRAIGYLYYAELTSKESTNCERSGPNDSDYHMGIGFDAGRVAEAKASPAKGTTQFHDLQANSMIAEMTPYYRAQFEPQWTLTKLQAAYGMQVMVVGQLTADNDHHLASEDCGMSGATSACWRLSIWEIHPVTSFSVCTASGGCADANSTGWTKLEAWTASPGKKKPPKKPPKKPAHSPPA
jgi:hypothetical protein